MSHAYFVSDSHLTSMQERNSQTLLRFFHSLKGPRAAAGRWPASHLFLVGDIFDLWIGSHEFFIRRFEPLVAAVAELVKSGVEVHFFEGNHDLYLHEFWQERLGVKVHADAAYFELFGRRVRVEHGDLINPDDQGYLFLRRVLRSPGTKWLARNLPSAAVHAIGSYASRASRGYTSTSKRLDEGLMRDMIRSHAHRAYSAQPFDTLITGHVHLRDEYEWQDVGRCIRSVNLGSWLDGPKAFALSPTDATGRFLALDSESPEPREART